MCGLYELNLVEIRYFGDKYLSYWRNGNLQYFTNGSELNGQGTHNLNFDFWILMLMTMMANVDILYFIINLTTIYSQNKIQP